MARYIEIASEINEKVKELVGRLNLSNRDVADIGYIVNLAIRACPRGVQHTVRKNIVSEATKGFCHVSMEEVEDAKTGNSYNKIDIRPLTTNPLPHGVLTGVDPYRKIDVAAKNAAYAKLYGANNCYPDPTDEGGINANGEHIE